MYKTSHFNEVPCTYLYMTNTFSASSNLNCSFVFTQVTTPLLFWAILWSDYRKKTISKNTIFYSTWIRKMFFALHLVELECWVWWIIQYIKIIYRLSSPPSKAGSCMKRLKTAPEHRILYRGRLLKSRLTYC